MKKSLGFLGIAAALMGGMGMYGDRSHSDESAKDRRKQKDRRTHVPPRSMTPEEQVHYDKHKNLHNFYK